MQQCRLWMQAKIGELMPAGKRGRGNKIVQPVNYFGKHTLAKFRKVAAAKEKIDAYYEEAMAEERQLQSNAQFDRMRASKLPGPVSPTVSRKSCRN